MEDIKNKNKMTSFGALSHQYFQKSTTWHIVLFIILIIFAGLFVILGQYLSTIVIIGIGIAISVYSQVTPKQLLGTISKEGIRVGDRFYPFIELKSFWIADIFPNPILYLEPAIRFKSVISITLKEQSIAPIKKVLSEYLPFRMEKGEDIGDKLIRIFKV